MTDFDFERPPNMSTPEGVAMAEWLSRQFLKVSNAFVIASESAPNWRGTWVAGEYARNDLVVDHGWLSLANKETISKPAPQPTGDVRNVINTPGAPTFTTNSVVSGSFIVAARYTFSSYVYIRKARVYFPAAAVGLRADVYGVLDPTTDPSFRTIASSQVIDASETGQWIEIPIGLTLVQGQRIFDVLLAFTPTTGAVNFTYNWSYLRSNQNPNPGEIRHKSGGDANTMLVHEQDSSLTDRSTDLDNVTAGSEIEMLSTGTVWKILSATKAGDIYTFTVSPAARAVAGVSDFTFTYFGPITINYVEALNHYNTMPEVQGFTSTTGYNPIEAPPILTQNAYGIDIQAQGVLVSGDWDYLAFTD